MTTRRSRRLSCQVPVRYDGESIQLLLYIDLYCVVIEEGWEATDLLMYLTTPVSEAPSPAPSTFYHSLTQSDAHSPRRHTPSHRRTPEHVPRPPNAFMLFRSDYWRETRISYANATIARLAASAGNSGDPYHLLRSSFTPPRAISAKEDHLVKYPDYKFRADVATDKDEEGSEPRS